jgi:hypothetical protein
MIACLAFYDFLPAKLTYYPRKGALLPNFFIKNRFSLKIFIKIFVQFKKIIYLCTRKSEMTASASQTDKQTCFSSSVG